MDSQLELANLICKFGDKVLLDLAHEVVLPAFRNETHRRTFGETSYFFLDVAVGSFEDIDGIPSPAVIGRLVKNTTLERRQLFDEGTGKLVKAPHSLPSSPSSIFVLLLSVHRLLYVREMPGAPSLDVFRATLLRFLRAEHESFVAGRYQEQKGADPKTTRKKVLEEFPKPTLDLIPLTSDEDLEAFVSQFGVLTQFQVVLKNRNDEVDDNEFFEGLQKRKDKVKSATSTLTHRSSAGLDKNEVLAEAKAATEQGNQIVNLVGTDPTGAKLWGNNERFQLKHTIANLGDTVPKAAEQMFNVFRRLVANRAVKLPILDDATKQKIEELRKSLKL